MIKQRIEISLLGGNQGNILEIFVFNNIGGQLFLYKIIFHDLLYTNDYRLFINDLYTINFEQH